ncbi:hypothetical protein SAMN04489835_3958 [Mycolicibacterium rutilum]|uniref:Uncharacterized protein n=1 Tax=Mycolicibacterium rutilum TaxID=370526 RepID=A0A1H6KWL8_MYCRU|nr:hypothetical protein [Mycolicibacterium rutilum]SEH77342.1 hypothetical protein SAMN04489835_3958 [Mycolicibacterium rutilum]
MNQRVTVGVAAAAAILVGCSSPATETPARTDCAVDPASAPPVAVEAYQTVPEADRITLTLSDIGPVTPGGPPVEVEVTMCNDSAVDYPDVGVVLVLGHCSCAPNPTSIPAGTVHRFDENTGSWALVEHPTAGLGVDYLGTYADVRPMPKGQRRTARYRIALDGSMTAGQGVVEAAAVTPEPLNRIGTADTPFAVG